MFLFLLNFTCVSGMSAQNAIVMDAQTGRIFYEHNAHEKKSIASTTKIMTAIVVLENCKLDDIVTVSYKAATTEGSSMYLKPNEKITVENLLYGLMLNSGNDAATALAEHTSGSIEKFALLMNKKAKEIGMNNSSFANPHGLDNESHYSTAYDMALLTKYAMENDKFREIVGTKKKIIKEHGIEKYKYLTNHNKLLSKYEWCKGVKTGFTKKSGRCLASYAEKNGVKLITITLNAPDDWNDHINKYEEFFNLYKCYKLIDTNDYICSVNIDNAEEKTIKLYNCKAISLTLNEEEYKNLTIRYNYPATIKAPIYINQVIGNTEIISDGKVIASSPIISKCGVPEKTDRTYKESLKFLINNLLSMFKI